MDTKTRIWRDSRTQIHDQTHARYEDILGRISTGVFILEPTHAGACQLDVVFVNEMGARFFGRLDGRADEILDDAAT